MDHQPRSLPQRLVSVLLSSWGKVLTALLCLKVFAYTRIAYDQMDATSNYNTNLDPSFPSSFNANNYAVDTNNKANMPPGLEQFNIPPPDATDIIMQQPIDEIQQRQQQKQQQQQLSQEQTAKDNCQIIYILGVEGAIHHGFTPIIETLAKSQVDPDTGRAYEVTYAPKVLRSALFGLYREKRDMDDPTLIAKVFRELCPLNDGKKHVIIEDSSFPSGAIDDPRSYRIHRQASWMKSTMEQVANDELAQNHPTNLYKFYELYSRHANIQFILLHRPFLETMASHANDWGEEVVGRSNMIRGFMLILKQFLVYIRQKEVEDRGGDPSSGIRGRNTKKRSLSTIVCADKIMSKNYDSMYETTMARQHIIDYVTEFLDWPSSRCPQCFSKWKESKKDVATVLGEKNLRLMLNDMKELEGIWPPFEVIGNGLPEQQCDL